MFDPSCMLEAKVGFFMIGSGMKDFDCTMDSFIEDLMFCTDIR